MTHSILYVHIYIMYVRMFLPQAHLLGLFDNVKTVTFHEKEYDKILKINSREPETIEVEYHASY